MKQIDTKRGISLIETIIYVAIFSFFVIGIAQFSNTLSSTRLHTQSMLEVNDQGSKVIKMITQTLRNSNSVNVPSTGSSSSNLNLSVDYLPSNINFYENNGIFYINEGPGSPMALTNNKVIVSDLMFSNLSRSGTPSSIKVKFTITSVSTKYPYSITFESSSNLRK